MLAKYVKNFGQKCLQLTQKNAPGFLAAAKNNYATEATFETKPCRLHNIEEGPSNKVTVNREDALTMYKNMFMIRRIDTSAGNMYNEKYVRGFCHLYFGEEAVAVGIRQSMRPQDSAITSYRAHAWTYLMGVPPLGILSELAGRQGGTTRGKGGSMHMYTRNFYGGNGIVGAQVPLGAGVALAAKYKGTDGVCFALYGDGASNQGQIWEAYNMCKLWNVPCIFVCENNGYGMGTSSERSTANTLYYTRGDAVPGIWVDGMDVLACREAAKFVINYGASGKGPILVEFGTYRYCGHSMSDPGTSYRSREEVQQVRQTRDPIASLKERIISTNLATADELKDIEAEIKHTVDEATKQAKADKEIGLDELVGDIYSHDLEKQIRNVDPYTPLPHKRIGPAINYE